jgi:ribosomal protein S18 acetylase RimI-like enzyme
MNTYNSISSNEYIDYLLKNEYHFVQVLDKFNNDYTMIPYDLHFKPFIKNNKIDSLIAYTDNGLFFPYVGRQYIKDASLFIINSINDLFSIYGQKEMVDEIYENLTFKTRHHIEYYEMLLEKKHFLSFFDNIEGFKCAKCNSSHFRYLKNLQYLYHIEEVYNEDSYYPHEAEMKSFKQLLDKRLNYAVFMNNEKNTAVSKANVNGESPNCYQIGGIYTLKEYRNLGLSKLCISHLLKEAFDQKKNILLYVKKENKSAISVYDKLGFKILKQTCLYYF